MTTRWGLFCERVSEAGLAAALIITPLLINRYGDNEYDVPRGVLIHSLALIILAAFIIRKMEGEIRADARPLIGKDKTAVKTVSFWRNPLFFAGLLLGASYLVSTILSVTPHTSWWGHPGSRFQGSYVILSCIVIFGASVLTFRTAEQLERLVTTIILTSSAVCVYGLYQASQFTPIWGVRIDATLGNPIFLGSYLLMVIFLTGGRLVRNFRRPLIIPISYGLLLLMQLACLVATQSRGPVMIGLIVGGIFFLVLWFITRHLRKFALWTYGVLAFILVFLIVFNIPGGPLEPLKKVPYLGRLGQIFETEGGAGKVRLLIWEGMIDMVKAEPARAVVGYGPEMMKILYYKYAPPELITFERHVAFPERAHSDFFDILATNGFIGVLIYLLIISLVMFYLLKYLGLVNTKRQRIVFILLAAGGILAGICLPYLVTRSLIYIGVGTVFGIIAAGGLYLLLYLIFWWPTGAPDSAPLPASDKPSTLLFIGLGAALLAHFAELQFGINVNSTNFYGWVFLAFFLVVIRLWSSPAKSPAPAPKPLALADVLLYAAAAALILVVLIFNLVNVISPVYERAPRELILDSLWKSFTLWVFQPTAIRLWVMYGGLAVIGGLLIRAIHKSSKPAKDQTGLYLMSYFTIIAITGLIFLISHSWQIYLAGIELKDNTVTNLSEVKSRVDTISNFYWWLSFIVLFSSILLYFSRRNEAASQQRPSLIRWGNYPVYLVLISVVCYLIVVQDVNLIKSTNLNYIASQFQNDKKYQTSLEIYEEVKNLAPDPTYAYASIAETYRAMAEREPNTAKKVELSDKSLEYTEKSLAFEPLSWNRNANVARLYRFRRPFVTDPAKRAAEIKQADNYYQSALALCPKNPELLNEIGEFYMELQSYQKAIDYYEASLRIDKTFPETLAHLGIAYAELNQPAKALDYYNQAVESYQHSDLFFINPNQDNLYYRAHQGAIDLSKGQNWRAYYGLARWELKKGKTSDALAHAQQALAIAPPDMKPEVEQFIKAIKP